MSGSGEGLLLLGKPDDHSFVDIISINADRRVGDLPPKFTPVDVAGVPGRMFDDGSVVRLVWDRAGVAFAAAAGSSLKDAVVAATGAVQATSPEEITVNPLPAGYQLVARTAFPAGTPFPAIAGVFRAAQPTSPADFASAEALLVAADGDPRALLGDVLHDVTAAPVRGDPNGWRGRNPRVGTASVAWRERGALVAVRCRSCAPSELDALVAAVEIE